MTYQEMLQKAAEQLGKTFDYMWPKMVLYAFVQSMFFTVVGVVFIGIAIYAAYKAATHKSKDYLDDYCFVASLVVAGTGVVGAIIISSNIAGVFVPEVAALKMILNK